jgi:Family of unknown function (DUF6644)
VLGFMTWLESSALGHFMRESGPWTYAIVNLAHILGIASLFGAILIMDLRLLGVWRRVPLAALADTAPSVAACGLAMAVASGAALFATKATEYVDNPFIYVKFPAIALGIVNAIAVRRSAAWRARASRDLTPAETRRLAWMGALSLVSWLTAIAAGRLIAYG